jgi:hypothetical protein
MRTIRTPILAVAVAALLVAPGAVLAATPVDDGCPASTELMSVADLESSGPYGLPGILDAAGNGDGYICAFALPGAVSEAQGQEVTVYQFFENNLPAQGVR